MKIETADEMATGANNILLQNRNATVNVQIVPCQPKTLTHLPKRPKVDLTFSELTYTVKQNKSK